MILAFAQGELSPAAARELEVHIDGCTACAELVADAARSLSGPSGKPSEDDTIGTKLAAHHGLGSTAPPRDPFAPGQSVGRYRILQPLGAGGMGVVYRAHDPELDRAVAVKLLRSAQGTDGSDGDARLIREAQLTAQLTHPNIVSVFEVGVERGHMYLAMELVEGQTLREWLEETHPLDAVLEAFVQAARGLAAAHRGGVVHRDFKPDNVLVGETPSHASHPQRVGRVRVMDFGLARLLGAGDVETDSIEGASASMTSMSDPLTATGTVMGTPAYMAPEQHAGSGVGEHSDQYAFFVALYEALYGTRPFSGRVVELAMQKQGGPPALASRGKHPIPRWLRRVLRRGLQPDPAKRFATMDAVARVLEHGPRRVAMWMGATGVMLAIGMLGVTWATTRRSAHASGCADLDAVIDTTWGSEQRDAVREALLATGLSYAEQTWTRVDDRLTRHADAWRLARVAACEAAARGEDDEAVATTRRSCLERRRAEMSALIRVLSQPDANVTARAVRAVAELPDPADCRAVASTPEIAADADAEARALEERLREADALGRAGRYEDALEIAREVEGRARTLELDALLHHCLVAIGEHASRAGAFDDAASAFEEAFFGSRARGDAPLATRAATSMAGLLGTVRAQTEEARGWLRHAEAELGRHDAPVRTRASLHKVRASVLMGAGEYDASLHEIEHALALLQGEIPEDDLVFSDYLNNLGNAFYMLGRYEEAIAQHKRALALREENLGDAHPLVGDSCGNIGAASFNLGRYDDAIAHHQRALAIARGAMGDRSHDAAIGHNNLGGALHAVGRHDEAIEQYRASLEVWSEIFGEDDPHVALAENNLGNVYQSQGQCNTALEHYRHALDIRTKKHGREHPDVAATLNNEGICLKAVGRIEEARTRFEEALEIQEKTIGPTHPDLGHALYNLGVIFREQGRHEKAIAHHRRALEVRQAALGTAHHDVGESHHGLGRALLESGDANAAARELDVAVAVLDASAAASLLLASARFDLARALWATGERSDRVVTLARDAQSTYAARSKTKEADQVSRWLRDRH